MLSAWHDIHLFTRVPVFDIIRALSCSGGVSSHLPDSRDVDEPPCIRMDFLIHRNEAGNGACTQNCHGSDTVPRASMFHCVPILGHCGLAIVASVLFLLMAFTSCETAADVHTLELTELGFSMLAWNDGPAHVFSALLDSCFEDLGPSAAEARRLQKYRTLIQSGFAK